jgi:hypothetical protein
MKTKSFPANLFNEDLIQHGHGQCETFAEKDRIELHLEHGILVLWPDGS